MIVKLLLCILDGFGIDEKISNSYKKGGEQKYKERDGTRFAEYFYHLFDKYPSTTLHASGKYVGLPDDQPGNSEVGHKTIGLGTLIPQSLIKLNNLFYSKEIWELDALKQILNAKNKRVHVLGLLSSGGGHSHEDHIISSVKGLIERGREVYLHIFLDGRDTLPKVAIKSIEKLFKNIEENSFVLSTISGRYYSMDRDNRIDRTKRAIDAICFGKGDSFDDPIKFIEDNYKNGITDEFIIPHVSKNYKGALSDDNFWHINFRADRVKQLFLEVKKFSQGIIICTSDYGEEFKDLPTILHSNLVGSSLGEILSDSGKRQIRISETEKYAHVTYFFNGGKDIQFKDEDRIMIESPKIATYDMQPEMKVFDVTNQVINSMNNGYDFIVVNYANPDMVGHTAIVDAIKKTIIATDLCIKNLKEYAEKYEYALVITSDHGNVDCMWNDDNTPNTSHTMAKVPFIAILPNAQIDIINKEDSSIIDIAPTILDIMGIKIPKSMTGNSLVKKCE